MTSLGADSWQRIQSRGGKVEAATKAGELHGLRCPCFDLGVAVRPLGEGCATADARRTGGVLLLWLIESGCVDSGRVSDRIVAKQPERRLQSRAAQPARCVRTLDGGLERRLSGDQDRVSVFLVACSCDTVE